MQRQREFARVIEGQAGSRGGRVGGKCDDLIGRQRQVRVPDAVDGAADPVAGGVVVIRPGVGLVETGAGGMGGRSDEHGQSRKTDECGGFEQLFHRRIFLISYHGLTPLRETFTLLGNELVLYIMLRVGIASKPPAAKA